MASKTTIQERQEAAFKLLIEKGLSLRERLEAREAFTEWGRENDPTYEKDDDYWKTTKVPGFLFNSREEAQLMTALAALKPEADTEALSQVLSIVLNLLEVESGWAFKVIKK